MKKNEKIKPKKVLLLGSGGLRIGQAGEFDYSGSQAIKALKEEGIKTVLINPNIATVQTDPDMADEVYLQPLNIGTVTKIIKKERPDGILLSFGGQTALNLGLELFEKGILKKYNVEVLGTPISSIKMTEDRDLFKKALTEIDIKTAKSFAASTVKKALEVAQNIGYPVMMRSGYSLGGLGSGVVKNATELKTKAGEALSGTPQILIEEYLGGWKEVEYEIVRDIDNNTITVCNMENMDPMGIHTGESIVVAPSQTLNNKEYYSLRQIGIKTVQHIGVIGECNIQYALNPKNGDYRVIEINARLSRSSALASKATGYPLAFVAAKLALGIRLDEIKNAVTKKTSAFFEPALDYLVVKIPRWDINKFKAAEKYIGSEMKSVGEVMAIGRSFPECLQKAVRMLNIGATGLHDYPYEIKNPKDEVEHATFRRLFAIYKLFQKRKTVDYVQNLSKIDPWFLHHIKSIAKFESVLSSRPHSIRSTRSGQARVKEPLSNAPKQRLDYKTLLKAKKLGFSDKAIANFQNTTEKQIRQKRIGLGITPVIKQIDTLAGEFPAETNYLYTTYNATRHDIKSSREKSIIVLGSGPYCIGSSVEFDWCAVNTARTLKKLKQNTIIINSNPETVSTDYDESDRLYFEELTEERIRDIADFENPKGIIVSVGGQIANNVALSLFKAGYPILGTSPKDIDKAENRQIFSSLLTKLDIDQPAWQEASSIKKAKDFGKLIGYPLLVRPSYVLSGAAMNVVQTEDELENYLKDAGAVSPDHPVVISQFILNAKELEIDGVADKGEIVIQAISEHIENAGVHSGDATVVLPPQRLYLETIRKTKKVAENIAKVLNITGPFNIQFIAKDNQIKVIECNLRASRSFPFVSKVTGHNFIDICTHVFLGKNKKQNYETLELDHVGVKTPQFSYSRLKGADPVQHVEMAATGEVACLGNNYLESFTSSWLATEQSVRGKSILLSIGGDKPKLTLLSLISELEKQDWEIYTTEGTHDFLSQHGIASSFNYKISDNVNPHVGDIIENQQVNLIINIPKKNINEKTKTDGFKIRRLAIDHHIPLITNLQIARLFLKSLVELNIENIQIKSLREYIC